MKNKETEDLRPEYDFIQMSGRVRGKHAEAYRSGTNLAHLAPDVAAFTTDASVNEALQAILRVTPKATGPEAPTRTPAAPRQ